MSGYLDTRQMIIDTLMGRPEGTQIQPEDHQAYALNMLNYIRSIELSSGSTLTGIAETNTVPIEPLDSRVAYIGSVPENTESIFTYFKKENNEPITIITTNSAAFIIFMWNTAYWEYQVLPINVLSNDIYLGSINVGNKSSLLDAISSVPIELKKGGLIITYYDTTTFEWKSKQYVGTDLVGWNDENEWINYVNTSGGGGGSDNYNDLSNKPHINSVLLIGNKSPHDLGLATESDVQGIANKFNELMGLYYGEYNSVQELESVISTVKGYAYVPTSETSIYYIYTTNGNGAGWVNSGNKFYTSNLESNLETKSQTKAPTTKAVADGIESVNLLNTKQTPITDTQKYNASANINDRTVVVDEQTSEVKALGYKVLNPALGFAEQVENVVDNDVVIVDNSNTIFEIRDEFELNNASVSIPANCVLKFNGGKLKNGSVICSNTNLTGDINLDLVTLSGTIINEELKASYFGIKYSTNTDILTYNDSAFECLVTSCENLSDTAGVTITNLSKRIIIDRDISITEPIEITNANLICNKTIRYRGAQDLNGAVITIKGNYKEHIIRLNNNGIAYYDGTYESRKDLPIRGVTVTNFRKGYINFIEVTNFTHNIVFESSTDSDYVAYNTFDFMNVLNGLNALTINVINAGWINNNVFNRGTFNCYTESVFNGNNIAFLIKGNSFHGANQLIFNDNNIETSYIGIYLDTLEFEDSFINRLRNENVSDSNLIIENNVSPVQSYYKCQISLYRDNIGQENLIYKRFKLVLSSSLDSIKTYNWELSCIKKGSAYYFKQPVTAYTTPSGVYNVREVYALLTSSSNISPQGDKFMYFNSVYNAPLFVFDHNGKFFAEVSALQGVNDLNLTFFLINKTINSAGYRTSPTTVGFINRFAPLFSEESSYSSRDQVRYEGKYYMFKSAKSAGVWDSTVVNEVTALDNSYGSFYGKDPISSSRQSSPLKINGVAKYNDINITGIPTNYYLGLLVGGSLSKLRIDVKSNSTLVSENEPSIISCAGVPDSMIGYFPKNVDGSLVKGYSYWDSVAKKPIYWNSSVWVNALGEPAGLQVSDTSVLIDAAADSFKKVSVYYSGNTAPTITVLNSDDTANTWLTATPDPFTGNTLTLTAAANNTSAPRGAKVLVSLGDELVIINVIQTQTVSNE